MNNNYLKTLNNTLKECPDRVDSLRKYYPFFYLFNYRYITLKGFEHINMGEVCLSLLSFMFYENKLKNQKIQYVNIKDYLEMLLVNLYEITPTTDDLDEFTKDVLDKIQGDNGAGYDPYFPVYDKGKDKISNVKYITRSGEEESGKQNYEITPLAIDLLLATKEFTEESKITISLLLLKKLITDSEYNSALLSLTQVNAEVIKQIAKVYEIEMNLIYGGKRGYEAFIEYRNLADKRQKEEEELFSETMEQIRLLREEFATKVKKSELGEKERNAFKCLDEMDKELNKTVELHQKLLGKIVILTRKADEILKQKRVKLLRPSFDFSTYMDRLNKIGSAKNLSYFVAPFMPLNIDKSFSLGKLNDIVLCGTSKGEKDDSYEKEVDDDIKIDTDKFNREVRERVAYNYRYVMEYFYELLKYKEEIDMSEVIQNSSSDEIDNIFKNPDFVGVIIDMIRLNEVMYIKHEDKRSKSKSSSDDEESNANLLKRVISDAKKNSNKDYTIEINTIEGSYIEIAPGFNMTNVIIKRKYE